MSQKFPGQVAPATGKLGVLCVGLGAVTTTFFAGVENARRGLAQPFGALTQMGTIRLGKRTEHRAPLIKDFVPLADLKDLVLGAGPGGMILQVIVALLALGSTITVVQRFLYVRQVADALPGGGKA